MALISTRKYFEDKGYKVDYDSKTGNIRVYNPKTGSSSMVMKGAYSNVGGTSKITSDVAKQVESTLASGKYKYTGGSTGGSSSKSSSSASSSSKSSSINLENERNYLQEQLNKALNEKNTGLADWARNQASQYGITLSEPSKTLTPWEQAVKDITSAGLPVTSLDPEYVKAIAEGTVAQYFQNKINEGKTTTPQQSIQQLPYSQAALAQTYNQNLDYIIDNFKNTISDGIRNSDVNTAPMYAKALEEIMSTLDQYQTQITQQMQQQMGGVDPATLAAISNLRETVKQQRDYLMEEMSRRGLLQSGLWIEAENRLNKGELTAQQQLLASRLSDLQNQLNQALMNFGSMRLNALQTYGLAGIQAAQQEALNRQQQLERNLQMALDEAYRRQQLALQQFQTTAPYMYLTEAQRQGLPAEWSQITGEVAAGPGYQNVPVRSYVGSSGTVSYDSNTGDVIINGTRINPVAVGGYISNGMAYLPQNLVDTILGKY